MRLLNRLKHEILVADGAMGTMLQADGLPSGSPPEIWNLTHSKKVKKVHSAYLKAGADIITTNTFGANRVKLKEFRLDKDIKPINELAVKIARSVAKPETIIAGSIGPTGKFLKPFGELDFDFAYKIFCEQAKYLAKADIIIIETMIDILELKAAILGIRDVLQLPIIAQLSFNEGIRTVTGTDPAAESAVLEALGIKFFGANCGGTLEDAHQIVKILGEETSSFLIIQPNAGIPPDNKISPSQLADFAIKFVKKGANIVGSCCGSTPEHTKHIVKVVKGMEPIQREKKNRTCISSRTCVVYLGSNESFLPIGERINPSGKPKLEQEMKLGKLGLIKSEAITQVEKGAKVLDINVGIADYKFMIKVIQELQKVVSVPLFIDSQDPTVIENALKVYAGKSFINSVNGREDLCAKILPLAKRYGAGVIGLTIDKQGIPKTSASRLRIAKKILKLGKLYGIRKEDIIIDSLVLPIGSYAEGASITLESLKRIKKELGVPVILGISNISYGLPDRNVLNQTFLSAAIQDNLDAAILDPYDSQLMKSVAASELLAQRDIHAKRYISRFRKKTVEMPKNPLYKEILLGNKELIPKKVKEFLKSGFSPLKIINEILIPAIKEVGDRYSRGELFLPQLIASSEAAKLGFSILTPLLSKTKKKRGKILLATVEGDMHDLGKNLVGAMLEANGYLVVDIGKDVKASEILKACRKETPDAIGLSCLLTTTLLTLEATVKYLNKEYPDAKIMVGGACVSNEFAKKIGVTYAKDAIQTVKEIKNL